MTSGYQAYQTQSALTATPEQLVVMLFDGALRFSRRALAAWENGDRGSATAAVGRVVAILNELNATLDMEAGGEIARNLRDIYLFLNRHLLEAISADKPANVRQTIELLTELREGFAGAARMVRAA